MSNFYQLSFYKMYNTDNSHLVLHYEDHFYGEDLDIEVNKLGQVFVRKYYADGEFSGLQPVNLYDELVKLLNRLEEQGG